MHCSTGADWDLAGRSILDICSYTEPPQSTTTQQTLEQIVRIISQMMVADQRFSLRWNNYQSQMVKAFENLLDESDFVDVTLGVEGKKLSAHKMLLSACSPYFRELLKV